MMTKEEAYEKLSKDRDYMLKQLITLYSVMESKEKEFNHPMGRNSLGFGTDDGGFLMSLASQYLRKNSLSAKQIKAAQKIMPRYAQQVADIENFGKQYLKRHQEVRRANTWKELDKKEAE